MNTSVSICRMCLSFLYIANTVKLLDLMCLGLEEIVEKLLVEKNILISNGKVRTKKTFQIISGFRILDCFDLQSKTVKWVYVF